MADWAFSDSSRFGVGGTASLVGGGTVVSHTTINTKGEWQTIVPSVPFDADVITTQMFPTAPVGFVNSMLIDIGRGTVGSEQTILSNVPVTNLGESRNYRLQFPYEITQGERISARSQSDVTAKITTISCHFELHGFAHFAPGGRAKTYGANTTNSHTTPVIQSATPNAKGSWTQIAASTSDDIYAIIIMVDNEEPAGLDNDWYLFDIGIGSSGSERIIVPDMAVISYSAASAPYPNVIGPLPCSIPAGSRIAMRIQSTNTFRDVGFVIVGLSR